MKVAPFLMLVCLLAGRATVQPYEREGRSDPIMIIDENAIESGRKEHHLDYREGTKGATGAQSGGRGWG